MLPIVHQVCHYSGHFKKRMGAYFEWTHKTHIVSLHVTSGGNYIVGREEFTGLRSPYLGILAAGERDANGLVGPYEMYWCSFDWPGCVQAAGRQIAVVQGRSRFQRSHVRGLSPAELRGAVAAFRELQSLSRNPDFSSRVRAGAKVAELIAMWAQPSASGQGGERAVRIFRNLIDEYAVDPGVKLESLAERVGMSADHLGLLFRLELGLTPVEYRARLRLLRARELLLTTARRISEIARECGYPDANYFARAFRKQFGLSPRGFVRSRPEPLHG